MGVPLFFGLPTEGFLLHSPLILEDILHRNWVCFWLNNRQIMRLLIASKPLLSMPIDRFEKNRALKFSARSKGG